MTYCRESWRPMVLHCAGLPRAQARRSWRGEVYEWRLKRNAKLCSSVAMLLCSCSARGNTPSGRAGGLDSEDFLSCAAIPSTLAIISSVGSTQSIGIELQRSVGQLSRSAPLPRVPSVS